MFAVHLGLALNSFMTWVVGLKPSLPRNGLICPVHTLCLLHAWQANGTQNIDQKVTRRVIMSLLWADTNKWIDAKHCVTSQCEVMWWLYDWIIYFVPTLLSSWTLKGYVEVNELNSLCVCVLLVLFQVLCCTNNWVNHGAVPHHIHRSVWVKLHSEMDKII